MKPEKIIREQQQTINSLVLMLEQSRQQLIEAQKLIYDNKVVDHRWPAATSTVIDQMDGALMLARREAARRPRIQPAGHLSQP